MRKYLTYFLFLFCFLQANAQLNFTPGTYKVDLGKTLELMEGEWKQKYDALTPNQKNLANQSMMDRLFVFYEEGHVDISWKVNESSKSITGTWQLNDSNNLLIRIGEQSTEYKMNSTESNGLALKNPNGKGFFNNLYLTRVD